jgi:carbamoyltransferase
MDLDKYAQEIKQETLLDNICLGGGVALNCVSNGKLLKTNLFKNIWVQPSCGDTGSALGCALYAWHDFLGKPRQVNGKTDKMQGSLLGPSFEKDEIRDFLDLFDFPYEEVECDELPAKVAQ